MKKFFTNKIVNWIAGFISATLIIWILFFLYIIYVMNDTEPIQYFAEYFKNYLRIIGIVILIIIPFVILKKKFPNFSNGLFLGLIWCLFLLIINSIDTCRLINPPSFNATIWKEARCKPIDMAFRVKKDNLAINKTRKEIIEMFGGSFIDNRDNKMIYCITRYNFTYLEVVFDDKGVSKQIIFRNYD
jgi:hypothetical protein